MTCIQQAGLLGHQCLSPIMLAPGKQFKLEAGYSPTNQTNQNHMTFGAVCSHFYGYTLCTNFFTVDKPNYTDSDPCTHISLTFVYSSGG